MVGLRSVLALSAVVASSSLGSPMSRVEIATTAKKVKAREKAKAKEREREKPVRAKAKAKARARARGRRASSSITSTWWAVLASRRAMGSHSATTSPS
jgi:hypothetical protein